MAKIIREDFLAQNAFTPYDCNCPFYKSVLMLKNIIHFHTKAPLSQPLRPSALVLWLQLVSAEAM